MKRPLSPEDYRAFWASVSQRDIVCVGCQQFGNRWKCLNRSGGRLDAHHLIPQQTLKRELPREQLRAALMDPRNGMLLGRYHHDLVESRMVTLTAPPAAWEFAEEYGLAHHLERRCRRGESV